MFDPTLRPSRIVTLAVFVAGLAASPSASAQLPRVFPANAQDLGPAPTATPIRRMQLVLARTAQQEQALTVLLDAQQDPASPSFHHWLTPSDFGARFGLSDPQLAQLTAWLAARGFTGIHPNAGRTLIEFSGPAAAVEAAFQPALHALSLGDTTLYTNRAEARIPAEIAPSVRGFASLSNLQSISPQPTPAWTLASNNTTYYPVTPYDFAAIYNIAPLWNAASPIDGTGQTIAIAGNSAINPVDFVNFRKLFGLPVGSTSSQTGTQYLNIIYNGSTPAVRDEAHGDSDTQWAAAVAKGAVIDYVATQTTEASSGVDLSAAYIVDNNLAPVMVYSYSTCEAALGASGNAFYNALWQQAAAQGITVVTATGDSGSAACDAAHFAPAASGLAVNGSASTPYDVAVGGTDFYAPSGLGAFFGANTANFQSASGYIPEMVWNDTCTNPALLPAPPFSGQAAESACNSAAARSGNLAWLAGSGGGASNCISRNGSTCTAGYPKPSWQTGPGIPADGARDLPDVSLFASQGRSNAFYVVCQQSRNVDGQPCNLSFPYSDFAGYGGTELAAPAFAGIMSLAVQKAGERIGNPNYTLYKLAALQDQAGTPCGASNSPAAACIFHDVILGTNAMICTTGSSSCTTATPGDADGILPGYAASPGFDLATGWGSVNVANLVNSWTTVAYQPTSAILSITPSSIVHGAGVIATVTVTSAAASIPTGQVSLNAQSSSGGLGSGPLVNGVLTQTFRNLAGGSYGLSAHYAGDASNAPADSNFVSVTVTPENSSTTLQTLAWNPATGSAASVSSAPYGTVFFIRADVRGISGQGIATGNIDLTDNGALFGSGVSRLNSSGYTEAQNNSIIPGTHLFAASYVGDPSFNPSSAAPASLTISKAATSAVVSAAPLTVSQAGVVTLSGVVNTTGYGFLAPSGNLSFFSGSQLLGTSALVASTDPATFYDNAAATVTMPASAFPLGPNGLTVVYPGDSNYLPSTSPGAPLQVTSTTLIPTLTLVSATPSTIAPGAVITFSASVAPATAGSNQPALTGTVQFVVDGQNLAAPVTLSPAGTASFSTVTIPQNTLGSHTVIAVYSGDQVNYRSSASTPATFLITTPGVASVPGFIATPSTALVGTFISVAVQIAPSTPVPVGTVQLILDGGPYGAPIPLVNGAATLPLVTSTLQAGQHALTVFYPGDGFYAAAYAPPAIITLSAPGSTPSAVALASLPTQISPGTSLAFVATVSPSNPVPTGIFQIILDRGNPGAPVLLAGVATPLTLPATSLLPTGPHTLQVFYSGDATYDFSTSPTYNFSVAGPVFTGSFTLTPSLTTLSVTASKGLTSSPSVIYTVTSVNGYSAPVALTCGALPAYTTCTMAPSTVSLQGVPTATSTLTLTFNTGFHAQSQPAPLPRRSRIPAATFAAIFFSAAVFSRRRRLAPALLAVLLALTLGALSGCGNSSYLFGTTPAGTYTLVVTATGGSTTKTANLDLIVN